MQLDLGLISALSSTTTLSSVFSPLDHFFLRRVLTKLPQAVLFLLPWFLGRQACVTGSVFCSNGFLYIST